MRTIDLTKTGALKARNLPAELRLSDIESSIKGCAPGEWVFFENKKNKQSMMGFVNPMAAASSACAYVLITGKNESPWDYIKTQIKRALDVRISLTDYGKNARMIFGASDGLPGLIVDCFENCALAQINTAGLDFFREQIKAELEMLLDRQVHLLDNEEYRKAEGLPRYEENLTLEKLLVREGPLSFELPKDKLQKIGFYYDHRENRKKLSSWLNRASQELDTGLDLFCYAGAWGMTLAKAGVKRVDFVDQADFAQSFKNNLKLNSLEDSHTFHQMDGFEYLKGKDGAYDIIVSDPPAFAKSPKGARKALEGYQKLHRLCLKALKKRAYFAACSCTRYVDLKEFLGTVEQAAKVQGAKVSLIDIGTQGLDHPCSGLMDKSNYLKYGLFLVEKL